MKSIDWIRVKNLFNKFIITDEDYFSLYEIINPSFESQILKDDFSRKDIVERNAILTQNLSASSPDDLSNFINQTLEINKVFFELLSIEFADCLRISKESKIQKEKITTIELNLKKESSELLELQEQVNLLNENIDNEELYQNKFSISKVNNGYLITFKDKTVTLPNNESFTRLYNLLSHPNRETGVLLLDIDSICSGNYSITYNSTDGDEFSDSFEIELNELAQRKGIIYNPKYADNINIKNSPLKPDSIRRSIKRAKKKLIELFPEEAMRIEHGIKVSDIYAFANLNP